MKQDEFIRLSRLIDEAKQRLDAEDEIAREHKSRERTEREPSILRGYFFSLMSSTQNLVPETSALAIKPLLPIW